MTLSADVLAAAAAAQTTADAVIAKAVATSGIAQPFVIPALLTAVVEQILARPSDERPIRVILALSNFAREMYARDPDSVDPVIPAMIEALEALIADNIVTTVDCDAVPSGRAH